MLRLEVSKSLPADKSLFRPQICLFFGAMALAVLVISKILAPMKSDVCGLMKKGPPKMIIGLHAKRHLNDGPINIEPACRSKQTGLAYRRFEDECDASTAAKVLHYWLKDGRSLSRQHSCLPNCFLEFSRVERRQIHCQRPHLGCISLRQADLE